MKSHSTAHMPSKSDPWIRNPKRFRLAMILTAVLTILSIRYPGVRPLYEEALLALHVPPSFSLGSANVLYGGVFFSGMTLWTLFLIWDSLNRHRILLCVALLWVVPLLSNSVLAGYQALIPSGVYAVDVQQEQQMCELHLQNGVASGNCEFTVKNRGGQPLDLNPTLAFKVQLAGQDRVLEIPLGNTQIDKRSDTVIGTSFSYLFPEFKKSSLGSTWYNPLESETFALKISDGSRERTWGEIRN